MEPHPHHRLRWLTQALLISVAGNVILLGLLMHFVVKESPPRPYVEHKPATVTEQAQPIAMGQSNADLLLRFKRLSMPQLIAKLSNTQLIENGYTQRDLALAALVAFHHFDLSRALIGHAQPTQQRTLTLPVQEGESLEVVVYPGLSEDQFQALLQFAQRERWPITAQGLFLLLGDPNFQNEASLQEAFSMMPEFLAVELLFNRSEVPVEKKELITVLSQGSWKSLEAFAEQQRVVQDLSPARRQRFLLDYLENGSVVAAYLLLKTDAAFAAKKLDDGHVLMLLKLLEQKTPESEQFALAVLSGPRTDPVWKLAAHRLYEYSGEPKPETNIHHAALMRFTPITPAEVTSEKHEHVVAESGVASQAKPITPPKRAGSFLYTVVEGDSLWKISRRFQVSIEAIKESNKLDTDFLVPGTTLKIPPSTMKR